MNTLIYIPLTDEELARLNNLQSLKIELPGQGDDEPTTVILTTKARITAVAKQFPEDD